MAKDWLLKRMLLRLLSAVPDAAVVTDNNNKWLSTRTIANIAGQ